MANKIIQLTDGTDSLFPAILWENNFTSETDLDGIKRTTNAFCNNAVNRPDSARQYGYLNSIFNITGNSGVHVYRVYSVANGLNVGDVWQREYINNQWYPWHIIGGGSGFLTPSSFTTAIPSGTVTTVGSITLTPGTWVITAGFQFTTSFTQGAYIALYNTDVYTIVRGTGDSGGGFSLSHIEHVTANKTISLQAYQGSGSSKTINRLEFRAVRVTN